MSEALILIRIQRDCIFDAKYRGYWVRSLSLFTILLHMTGKEK